MRAAMQTRSQLLTIPVRYVELEALRSDFVMGFLRFTFRSCSVLSHLLVNTRSTLYDL
jgi:hypothetical protein